MRMAKGVLKAQIEQVLRDEPETRNDDIILTIAIWKRFYGHYIRKGSTGNEGVWLEDILRLPREDHISRLRRHIQNVELRYLPTLWSVARQRKIAEDVWRESMRMLRTSSQFV